MVQRALFLVSSIGGSISPRLTLSMDIEAAAVDKDFSAKERLNELCPLNGVDPKKARFPCCIVWSPLPVVSWLAPYIGHVGICREDGTVLDFAGSNFVNIDNFAYGTVARYLQLDREQCCFPPNLSAHTCEQSYKHAEQGTAISWDDALHSSMQHFSHKYYNLFTCNCHSFVANCLNRLAYKGSVWWNMLNLAALILWKGQWVDGIAFEIGVYVKRADRKRKRANRGNTNSEEVNCSSFF
ncbi:unnamed protein product [Musa banksii]